MTTFCKHILCKLLIIYGIFAMASCAQECEEMDLPTGNLRLAIGQVSLETQTRATPSMLGKPLSSKFNLKLQRTGTTIIGYEGPFQESIDIKCGTYDILATCGEDVIIGRDTPYYVGTAQATVEKDKATSVNIPCKVANALLSVKFGRDEEERRRFDRFYENYGVLVRIDDHSLAITNNQPGSSIYFPAGSSPTLVFYGTLKMDNGRLVSMELASESLPASLGAAEHAMVTLTLPDPESAVAVDITKVVVETVTLDETIPLSWLPVPSVFPMHQYTEAGDLVGTNVTFSNSYPGIEWGGVITNESGEEVRAVEGHGELVTTYSSSSQWPYLSVGKYKAQFYIISEGTAKNVSSREFVVEAPQLSVQVDGYTSYTKYLEGDIDAANACNRNTVYAPSVKFNVSESLLTHGRYIYTFSYDYAGAKADVPHGRNQYSESVVENQAVSFNPYVLKAYASFDGLSLEAQKNFYITGLPVTYSPPTEGTGWVAGSDYVTFSASEVKLGHRGGLSTHYNESIYSEDFAIPVNTKVLFGYNIMIHPATEGTTLTITAGDDVLMQQREEGGVLNTTDYPHKGTTVTTITTATSIVKCHNSYGGGQTRSHIYSLDLKYSN